MAANGTSSNGAAPLLAAIYAAPSAEDCYRESERLCDYINQQGARVLESEGILASLSAAIKNKKSGFERESGAVVLGDIATKVGGKNAPSPGGLDPYLVPFLPALLDLYADKGDVVRSAAEKAAAAVFHLAPAEATDQLLEVLYSVIDSGSAKWQAKVGALKFLSRTAEKASEQVADSLVELIPHVTNAMHETKTEISKQAIKTATKVCGIIDNNDIRPFIPDLVGCMARPDAVPDCIKKLSSTTFVAEVTGPALAVMVPLLARALNERSQTVQRQTVIVVDNLCKLVRDPHQASRFLPELTPGVERIEKGASFPEVREHAKSALTTLQAATALVDNKGAGEDPKVTIAKAAKTAEADITAALKSHVAPEHADVTKDAWATTSIKYVASMVANLAEKRVVQASAWNDTYVLPYLRRLTISPEAAAEATESLRTKYVELDRTRFGASEDDDDETEGERVCNNEFSLAYGGLLLLNHTKLRLYRGHRYGIVAANGSGKSTLLKALRDGKVEGYPPQDVLRTIMVEHALQGEDASQAIIDFVASDPQLANKTRDEVSAALLDVGFDAERQANPVASLSGGWKMKLELARAMLVGADVLLLDEPTNHLDVGSVAWLEQYLVSNTQITVLTVSHDSGFLDNVCTDIIHYENKKLKYYKGNLSKFVENKPEAKSYYSLSATSVKFTFPPPGSLMGVRSNTRTILKLSNCTFTYPGMTKPSLHDASVAVSLSTRVGVLGPNGAGKSTLIKIMTGETIPQEGKVERHPNLRVAMMAQHAFHHLEQHLEKSACAYITWRYQDGHDREVTEKATRKMTAEEEEQLAVPITSKTGESRRIEFIVGRQKLKKSYQYEIKWRNLQHKDNTWIPRERLLELGFSKLLQNFDDYEASREGAGSRELSQKLIRKHLEAVGLNGEIAEHHEMSGLSGGQKVKVVLAAALWNNPQVLFLDEPTNFLDRDALAGLATAIRDWGGAVIIISHNMEFVGALCPEIWNVDAGRIVSKTRVGLVDGWGDGGGTASGELPPISQASTPGVGTPVAANGQSPAGTPAGSKAASRLNSAMGTPLSSAVGTPVGSDDEGQNDDMSKLKGKKGKKKMTRNEKKAQEERRRLRLSRWLAYGGEREPDTDQE